MLKNICFALIAVLLLKSCFFTQDNFEEEPFPLTVSTLVSETDTLEGTSSEPIIITYGDLDVYQPVYEALIQKFNEENSDIRVQFVAVANIKDELPRLADTFRASEGPNIGGYLDLKPLIDADSGLDRDDFYSGALQSPNASGAVYIMPHRLSCFNLLGYNRQLW